MRKFTVVILVLVLALSAVFALTGCNKEVDLPGRSWANTEVLSYEVYKGNVLYGAMVIKTERLAKGDHVLESTGKTYTVTSSAAGGTRVTVVVSDLTGKIIMKSESLLNGFTSLASYKSVDQGDVKYTVSARYDGKRYYYSVNGGAEKKIKEKSSFVDNELIYTIVRCYTLDSGSYAATFKVSDALNGSIENISVATQKTDVYYRGTTHVNAEGATVSCVRATDGDGNVKDVDSVKCVTLRFARSDSPVGNPAYVTYSVAGNGGLDVSGIGALNTKSTHVPVEIVENDMTYKLANIECK